MAILAVIPSDPLSAYEAKGTHVWLERYYNPRGFFEKVYLLSPLEKQAGERYGMEVVPTRPEHLRARLEELNVDVLRAYGGYWPCEMACRRGGKWRGSPVVVSVHDTNPQELYPQIRRADYVLCMSQAVRDLVLTRFRHPDRAWILPNRYDSKVMRPMRGEVFANLDRRYPWRYKLLCVGRISRQKNQDTVIRALAQLGPAYGCLFVGRNDTGPLKQLAVSLGVADQCRFVPSIRNDELARYYNWADAMVTPSRWEGFGLVFLEALACGAVVVTSNVRPMNEYIHHERNGLLVDDFENPRGLAGAIRRACSDFDLRQRMQRNGPRAAVRFERNRVDLLEVRYYARILMEKNLPTILEWLRRHMKRRPGALAEIPGHRPSCIATGQALHVLVRFGHEARAVRGARWLLRTQRQDGSWPRQAHSLVGSVRATGAVVDGLLRVSGRIPEAHGALRRGCDWLRRRVGPNGVIDSPDTDDLQATGQVATPYAVLLAAVAPLAKAARRLERPDYAEAVGLALDFARRDADVGRFAGEARHASIVAEAFLRLGRQDLAARALGEAAQAQRPEGAIPGRAGVRWGDTAATARYGRLWLATGLDDTALRAAKWLAQAGRTGRGLHGSYGPGAEYLNDVECAEAATEYLAFLDALAEPPEEPVT